MSPLITLAPNDWAELLRVLREQNPVRRVEAADDVAAGVHDLQVAVVVAALRTVDEREQPSVRGKRQAGRADFVAGQRGGNLPRGDVPQADFRRVPFAGGERATVGREGG